jgi:hypothetical protein
MGQLKNGQKNGYDKKLGQMILKMVRVLIII